tara:strand:- start:4333 stop:4599 length:267 start_codon:yes stop_codon:yes gene_type:complete
MFKNLLKKSKPLKLGRWGVTYEGSVLEKRINWANHDHCGSEVCETHFQNSPNKKTNTSKDTTISKDTNTSKDTTISKYEFDPLLPYCM